MYIYANNNMGEDRCVTNLHSISPIWALDIIGLA